jgi:hypothetical protein
MVFIAMTKRLPKCQITKTFIKKVKYDLKVGDCVALSCVFGDNQYENYIITGDPVYFKDAGGWYVKARRALTGYIEDISVDRILL